MELTHSTRRGILWIGHLGLPLLAILPLEYLPQLSKRGPAVAFILSMLGALALISLARHGPNATSELHRYRLLALVSLALALVVVFADGWNRHFVAPDSSSYARPLSDPHANRPPVYPLFFRIVNLGREIDPTFPGVPRNTALEHGEAPAALQVVRGQKLVLLGAVLLLAYALMRYLPPLLVAVVVLFCSFAKTLVTDQIDFALSESLAQAWGYCVIAAFLSFIHTRLPILLVLAGFLSGMMVLTRTAAVFIGVVLFVMFAAALLWDWRRHAPFVAAGIAAGSIVFFPSVAIYREHGILALTARDGMPAIFNALQVATPDVARMPDDDARRFLRLALERKTQWDRSIMEGKTVPREEIPEFEFLGGNLHSAMEAARAMGYTGEATILLFRKVSAPILAAHRPERMRNIAQAIRHGVTDSTRLLLQKRGKVKFSFWALMTLCLLLAAVARGWYALFGGTLILGHLAHLLIICLNDVPQPRYIYFSEGIALLGIFVLVYGLAITAMEFVSRLRPARHRLAPGGAP